MPPVHFTSTSSGAMPPSSAMSSSPGMSSGISSGPSEYLLDIAAADADVAADELGHELLEQPGAAGEDFQGHRDRAAAHQLGAVLADQRGPGPRRGRPGAVAGVAAAAEQPGAGPRIPVAGLDVPLGGDGMGCRVPQGAAGRVARAGG